MSYIPPELRQMADKIADYLDTLDVSLSLKHPIIKGGLILNTTKKAIKYTLNRSTYAPYIMTLSPIDSSRSVKEVFYNLESLLQEAIARQRQETGRADLADPAVISQLIQTQLLAILKAVAQALDLVDEIEKIIKDTLGTEENKENS